MIDRIHRALSQQIVAVTLLMSSLLLPTRADSALNLPQSVPAAASHPVPPVSNYNLTVLADASTSDASTSHAGRFDFGRINTSVTSRLEHTFTVRNDASRPLMITRLQPSCGCTSAVLAGTGHLPVVLQPGQQVPVLVSINLEPQLSGSIRKTVSVFVAGQSAPVAFLEMEATLNTLTVEAVPRDLNFGRAHYGTEVRIPFQITAKNGAETVPLVANVSCSNPDVTLRLFPPSLNDKLGALCGVAILSAQAHLGQVDGQVLVLSPAGDAAPFAVLPVLGQVNGDISVAPSALTWDSIATVLPQTRRILLTASTPNALDHLRFSCTNRILRVHLEDATTAATATLIVSLVSVTNRQIIARILVTTANGQQLQIPVIITPPTIRSATSSAR